MTEYAEVAALLPVYGTFHYEVPARLAGLALPGCRVLVPFGNRGVTGVVISTAQDPPAELARIRAIDALLDQQPAVSTELLELCLWLAAYYEAPLGEVLRAALPAGAQVSASQIVRITDAGSAALAGHGGALPKRARELLAALEAAGGVLPQKRLLAKRGRLADLGFLIEAGFLAYERQAGRARVRARTERWARLVRPIEAADRTALARAPRRLQVLEAIADAGGEIAVSELRSDHPTAAAHLRALRDAGLVATDERELPPGVAAIGGGLETLAPAAPPSLNAAQRAATDAIISAEGFAAFLLHGVTGSGKTEVYLHAIAETLRRESSAIVLVPEISLTPQLAARFRARFGDAVAVLHSGLTDRERFDEWQRLRGGSARIALGARSAVFAPLESLGIIVVDEEHDSSFKQEEGVRYNARDVALVRAQRAGGVCVLGSATPSLESFAAASLGRYTLLSLPERATARPLPAVEVVDLRSHRADSEAMLTAPLAAAIEETLAAGDQVILFLNRRGFATFVYCRACGHAFRCHACSVSLTYHRRRDRMLCHYCGHCECVPADCSACGATAAVLRKGLGTEKVADAIAERFAGARVARLDRDVAVGAGVERILSRMARRDIDILVGTQMVTKGHDFPGVTLVGVLWADTGLSLPDFRASERTFQLLTQVAGRAGRGDRAGRVIIQTFRPDEIAIRAAAAQDYPAFFAEETAIRREHHYPPFGHLVALRLDGTDAVAVEAAAQTLARHASALRGQLEGAVDVLGPAEAPLAMLKGRTRWHMWLRAAERRPLRRMVRGLIGETGHTEAGVRISVDVDPISAL